jgi:hypothetical protein
MESMYRPEANIEFTDDVTIGTNSGTFSSTSSGSGSGSGCFSTTSSSCTIGGGGGKGGAESGCSVGGFTAAVMGTGRGKILGLKCTADLAASAAVLVLGTLVIGSLLDRMPILPSVIPRYLTL